MYNIVLNTNTITHLWKGVTIIPILKPNKDHNIGTNYQTILLLSPIAKILEKTLLPYIILVEKQQNIPIISHQHGFKHKHSTHTALHNIGHQITKGFNNPRASTTHCSCSFNTLTAKPIFRKWFPEAMVQKFFFLMYFN